MVLGFLTAGSTFGAASTLVVALLWVGDRKLESDWPHSLALATTVVIAAIGVLGAVPAGWMLFGVLATLVAWDIRSFERRCQATSRIEDPDGLRRRHFRWVIIVFGLSALLSGVAITVHLNLRFWMAVAISLVLLLGLNRVLIHYKGINDRTRVEAEKRSTSPGT